MSGASPELAGVFQALEQDLVTAEVVGALEEAGIPVLVLKGPTFAQWLYGVGELRLYADSDLLVPRRHVRAAGQVLASVGYRRPRGPWQHSHAVQWVRGDRQVDLHHTLGLVDRSVDAWPLLAGATQTFVVAGREVTGLDEAGRCLHVALHAAQARRPAPTKAHEDLTRALEVAGDGTWDKAVHLARVLGCEAEMAAGLRTVAAGRARAARMGLTDAPSPRLEALRAPPWRRRYLIIRSQRTTRGKLAQLGFSLAGPGRMVRRALERRRAARRS